MSGTFPSKNTAEYLSIQSLMGPKLITVKARELMDKGIVSQIKINAIILNHDDADFADIMTKIKKNGDGKKAYLLEKEYVQKSLRRMQFFRKLLTKFKDNSLVLFHNISYGTVLFEYLRDNIPDMNFYYIDGSTSKEKREVIKKLMEETGDKPKILIASYGTFSTGVNIKNLYNIVFSESFKSDVIVRQSIGRGLRLHMGKKHLVLFDIVDRLHITASNILYNQYISRRDKIYKVQDFPVTELKIKI
jgi:superfamily II DNA or RNA helicase